MAAWSCPMAGRRSMARRRTASATTRRSSGTCSPITSRPAPVLGVDADYRAKVAAMRDKLVVPKIGRWGQLQEWMEDIDDPNDHHRHTSHLFGVFPGRQFTLAKTPDMVAAAKKSRWSRGATAATCANGPSPGAPPSIARMHDGEDAHRQFDQLFSDRNTCLNLFGLHPPHADGRQLRHHGGHRRDAAAKP